MTLTAPVRGPAAEAGTRSESAVRTEAEASVGAEGGANADAEGGANADAAPAGRRPGNRDADGLAVASFVLGLVGLLVMNILLGPAAIVMAVLALTRSTSRRGRALLGLALGIADLVVLGVLVTGSGTISWNFSG